MQKGFSLFEILISLLVISLVLFGFVEIELKSFREVRETHHVLLSVYADRK